MSGTKSQRQGSDRLKVAVCITGLEVGGAETTLAELLTRKPDNIDLRVYALIDGGRIAEQISAMGIPVIGLHMQAHRPNPLGVVRLWAHLVRFRPKIVHTWLYHADLIGGVAARLALVPRVVWHLHNCDLSPERVGRMTRTVVWLCARLSHVVPDRILSCSQAGARVHANLGYARHKLRVVTNGVDATRFVPSPSARASVRTEFALPDGCPIVGFVARVDPEKNHQGFFDAVTTFFREGGDAHFLLAGRDVTPDHWLLSALKVATGRPERIILAGPRSDVPRLMASFDVAASSSLGEAFPLVLVEAMSCGIPAAVTDVGDSALIVGDCGIVVPPSDPDALAKAWAQLLSASGEEREALAQRARQKVLDNYTIEKMADAIWNLYSELAGQAQEAEPALSGN